MARFRVPRWPGSSDAARAIAESRGLRFAASVDPAEEALPSLVLTGTRKDVAATEGEPRVELGNHGTRLSLQSDDFVPSRQGYVAVRHGLALPHLLVGYSGTVGAMTPLNVANTALTLLSSFDENRAGVEGSGLWRFQQRAEEIALPPDAGFRAYAEAGDVPAARALLGGPAGSTVATLAGSFALEVDDGWTMAYSFFGDLVTDDAEVWDWALSVASRVVDLARLWGAGPAFGEDLPFYTEQTIARPSKLDGSLRFLRGSV
ncbi:MAG: hypothetical protein QM572_14990 [Nocardioides sp.]|uniref:hypothetical protein n=1 Tax=Nocardioides sp. TaxID=35761 RepID=UPI0039E25911